MKRLLAFLLLMLVAPTLSDARTETVRAVEGDISIPYTSIGTLEVKRRVDLGFGSKMLQVMTLGIYQPSTSPERQKRALKSLLVNKAVRHYGANAIIHVHYWPDPDSQRFPQGFIYARGEMVRYVHFPAKS